MRRYLLTVMAGLFSFTAVNGQEAAPEAETGDMVGQEVISLLKSKGFSTAGYSNLEFNGDGVVIHGLNATTPPSEPHRALTVERLELRGLDAGYRWTRAETVSFTNLTYTYGEDRIFAQQAFIQDFGILDIDSDHPGFAFDKLGVLNAGWEREGASAVNLMEVKAGATQWKELYSVPGALDIEMKGTFTGHLADAYLPLVSEHIGEQAHPFGLQLRLTSNTPSGRAGVTADLKTVSLGDHRVDLTLQGVDDDFLSTMFMLGEENVLADEEQREKVWEEFVAQRDELSIRTLLYKGHKMEFLSTLLGEAGMTAESLTAVIQPWLVANSSRSAIPKLEREILAPLEEFVSAPRGIEIDVIPKRGTTYGSVFGKDATSGIAVENLGINVLNVR